MNNSKGMFYLQLYKNVNVLGGACCICQCKLQLDLNTKVNLFITCNR